MQPTHNPLPPGARRALIMLEILVGVLLAVVALLTTRSLGESQRIDQRARTTVAVTCSFYADLAAADTTLTDKSGELAVKLLADTRRIHHALGCAPPLHAPAPALRRLAVKFHVDLE